MRDGLSMNPVMAITQDEKGFMWFGTQDGLNKYDGYSFKVYKKQENDSLSISDNFVTALGIDREGKIWIGTLSGGLNCFDYNKKGFSRFTKLNSVLATNQVWCIVPDYKGMLFVGTDKGIYTISEGKPVAFGSTHPTLKYLDNYSILTLFHDSGLNIWIGTTEGLFLYSMKENKLRAFPEKSLSNKIVLSVFEDAEKKIWVGTLDGLNKWEGGNRFTPYFFKERKLNAREDSVSAGSAIKNIYSIVNNYGGNTIRQIMQDKKGNLWIGTDMELIIFNPATGKFVNYKKDLINPTGINDHFIRSMFKDRSDVLWIGTLGNGINKTDLKPKRIKHYQKKLNDPSSLSENYVRAIAQASNRRMWVGTLIGGLNEFDPETEKFTAYGYSGSNDGIHPNDNNVWSLFLENDSILWIGTNNGLNRYEIYSGKFSYYQHNEKTGGSLSENTVRSILVDSKGILWVGTEGGLNKLNRETGTFEIYSSGKNNPKAISDNTIWKIIEDNSGMLWIATNNGLNRFDPVKLKFTHYKNDPADKFSLSHNGVRTILEDDKGKIWVGTQNGLNILDVSRGKFKRMDEKNGLPNSFVYSIEQDMYGFIWISTNKGLAKIDPETFSVQSYDVHDGLQDYEFNTNASCNTLSGELYFAGPNGMNRFHPAQLEPSKINPNVEITMVKIFDRVYEGEKDISETGEIELGYDENSLYFEFTSLDFSNPSRNKYSYKMEGFDEDWIDAGHNRHATYTNLDPGNYIFKVRGTNSDGVWSNHVKEIRIVIRPPFWQTGIFYVLCVFMVLFTAYLIYRWRVRKLTKEKRILEEKVEERTKDLAEEKRKIEAFNRELEKLSLVASKTENSVIIANESGIIEWINEGFVKMHKTDEGYKNYYGKKLTDTSSNEKLGEIIEDAVSGKKSMIYESVNTNAEGKKFYVQSTLTPIFDENGRLKKIIIIDSDITERKKSEEIIRVKNKDITDSINYALRIQQAMLPGQERVEEILPESFVYFRPKDIVSGDFYFIEKITTNEDRVLAGFAVGDCTGHGVPGAFMSIIANNYLQQSLSVKSVNSPADALKYVSEKIYDTFSGKGENKVIRDGMDVSFCVYSKLDKLIWFAGANRPLIIVGKQGVKEIKGDAQPVGFQDNPRPFTNHSIQVEKGDMVYLFSDGYADQFGGPEGKKFKFSRFRELLVNMAELPLTDQKEQINRVFEEWKSWNDPGGTIREYEQLDDICVMGVRI
ncbi:MAG: two-component regulator propeller domain-containing protein [Bacteroidota bacterium]